MQKFSFIYDISRVLWVFVTSKMIFWISDIGSKTGIPTGTLVGTTMGADSTDHVEEFRLILCVPCNCNWLAKEKCPWLNKWETCTVCVVFFWLLSTRLVINIFKSEKFCNEKNLPAQLCALPNLLTLFA